MLRFRIILDLGFGDPLPLYSRVPDVSANPIQHDDSLERVEKYTDITHQLGLERQSLL